LGERSILLGKVCKSVRKVGVGGGVGIICICDLWWNGIIKILCGGVARFEEFDF
jgi:hypothetical protein